MKKLGLEDPFEVKIVSSSGGANSKTNCISEILFVALKFLKKRKKYAQYKQIKNCQNLHLLRLLQNHIEIQKTF